MKILRIDLTSFIIKENKCMIYLIFELKKEEEEVENTWCLARRRKGKGEGELKMRHINEVNESLTRSTRR